MLESCAPLTVYLLLKSKNKSSVLYAKCIKRLKHTNEIKLQQQPIITHPTSRTSRAFR